MLGYFAILSIAVLGECQAEVPVIRDGICPNFVPEPMPMENFYEKSWTELSRGNIGEGRTQWCVKIEVIEVNETLAIWSIATYDSVTKIQRKSSSYLTGPPGDFTFENRQTGLKLKRKVLGYTDDMIVFYACIDIPFYSYVEYISVIATYKFQPCDRQAFVESVLKKYQLENSLQATVQGNDICCQIAPEIA